MWNLIDTQSGVSGVEIGYALAAHVSNQIKEKKKKSVNSASDNPLQIAFRVRYAYAQICTSTRQGSI